MSEEFISEAEAVFENYWNHIRAGIPADFPDHIVEAIRYIVRCSYIQGGVAALSMEEKWKGHWLESSSSVH